MNERTSGSPLQPGHRYRLGKQCRRSGMLVRLGPQTCCLELACGKSVRRSFMISKISIT